MSWKAGLGIEGKGRQRQTRGELEVGHMGMAGTRIGKE